MEISRKNWGWFLFEGIIFFLLGIAALAMPVLFTMSFELLLGLLFIIGGIVQFVRTFKAKDSCWPIIGALLSCLVGGLLLFFPIRGALTMTFIFALFFLLSGLVKLIGGFSLRRFPYWGWIAFSGILEILIALLIWKQWPTSGFWAIGILIGVNFLFFGLTQIIVSFHGKSVE